jgi:uncharacterized membrane protein YgdD (TMEM256/DUF423 family)
MTQSENRSTGAHNRPALRGNKDAGSRWIAFAGVSGAVSVIAGAFAAHGMDADTQAAQIGWLHTGSQYEALHALAILAVAALAGNGHLKAPTARAAQILFAVGSIVFPGALYAMALGGPSLLGAVAPIGGLAFILGWLALALAALTADKDQKET